MKILQGSEDPYDTKELAPIWWFLVSQSLFLRRGDQGVKMPSFNRDSFEKITIRIVGSAKH